MGLYSDNFYSWLDRQYSRQVSDEETMAEHDKHYHKEGFNPETDHCEKRETEKKSDSVDSKDAPITESYLQKHFGMKVQPFNLDMSGDEAENFLTESFRDDWDWYATEPSEEERKTTIHLVGKVFNDIEDRFGCKLNVDNLLIAEFLPHVSGSGIGGCSLADRIAVKQSVMALATNPPAWGGETYGHKDPNTYREDIIRHELGHVLSTQAVRDTFIKTCREIEKKNGSDQFVILLNNLTSRYAMRSRNDLEFIAELFSRITSPDYRHTAGAEPFEVFVRETMLGGAK